MQPTTMIILAPAIAVLILFFVPEAKKQLIRWLSVSASGVTVVLATYMLFAYDKTVGGWQPRSSIADQFKMVLPLVRDSTLAKALLLLTLLPNIVIPIFKPSLSRSSLDFEFQS